MYEVPHDDYGYWNCMVRRFVLVVFRCA